MRVLRIALVAKLILVATFVNESWQAGTELLDSGQDICRLLKDNVQIRQPGSCNKGLVCIGGVSSSPIDCGNDLYSRSKGTCATSDSDNYCKSPCVASSSEFISDPKNCNGWYKCNGKTTISSGLCPDSQVFDAKQSACIYDNAICTATYNYCDVIPASEKIADEENCHKYYMCSGSTLKVYECEAGNYYHVEKGECLPKAQVKCLKHPIPDDVCGTTKLAVRGRFVSDQATCRGYFYCKDLGSGQPDTEPSWGECPVDKFFDGTLEACAPRKYVKCDEDRCDGRDSGYEISQTSGCRHYLKCIDGYTDSEEQCPDNMYFNAENEKCTTEVQSYSVCL